VIASGSVDDRKEGSVGKAVPGVELKLALDGELWVRGANITPGYWRNPEATAAAFEDGWYKTGDLGEVDAQGYLYLRGRKNDLIVLANGQNVYPEDLEAAVREAGGVVDAVVLGVPSVQGPRLHAVVMLEAGAPEPPAIVRRANSRLAAHQQIQDVTVWPERDFPRTHSLKVKRRDVLRVLLGQQRPAAEGGTAPPAAPDDASVLWRMVAEMAGTTPREITAQSTLGEIGLDSLQRVELLAALEAKAGLYLDESLVGPETTVGHLQALVEGHQGGARPAFPHWPLSQPAAALRAALQGPAFAMLDLLAPAHVRGCEVLAGLQPPVLFVTNHTSHLDSPVLLRALPSRWRRRVAVAAADDYFFARRALGLAVALGLNAFPFSRTTSVRPTLEHCAWLLDQGWSILLFPEGTRSVSGDLAPFKAGVGLLAVELGVPVVPVRLRGLHAVLPKGSSLPRPGHVRVQFGRAVRFAEGTSYAAVTAQIEEAVRNL
jgi:long-chain acyl-CoA synthetase